MGKTQYDERKSLYNPRYERDSCGVGVVADIYGRSSRNIVQKALQILLRLSHRGGVQLNDGDGAGILVGLPHEYFQMLSETCQLPFLLPSKGEYAVAQIFLPQNEKRRLYLYHKIEKEVYNHGLVVLGWRSPIPVRRDVISNNVKKSEPFIAQMFVCKRSVFENHDDMNIYPFSDIDFCDDSKINYSGLPDDLELLCFFIRKKLVRYNDMYICSFSSRTIVYKGLLTPSQIYLYFEDILSEQFTSYLAMVHIRFSTNTSPTWYAAHPFRRICHNGEINTISVNTVLFQTRLESATAPNFFKSVTINDLKPINEENYIIYDNDDEILQKKDTFEDIMLTQNRLKRKSRRNMLLKLQKDYTYNTAALNYKIKKDYNGTSDVYSTSELLSNVNDVSKSSSIEMDGGDETNDQDDQMEENSGNEETETLGSVVPFVNQGKNKKDEERADTLYNKNDSFAAKNAKQTKVKGKVHRFKNSKEVPKTKGALSFASDSATLDNAIEFLTLAGREIEHAVMMLMPRAYQKDPNINPLEKAFYEYHTCMMEPWDGPALVIFTDGNKLGASLDRNGLRPARYSLTKDGLFILSSETGVVDIPYDNILHKGCLYPGKIVLVDFKEQKFMRHEEVLSRFLKLLPYKKWLDQYSLNLDNIIKPGSNMENIRLNAYKRGAKFNTKITTDETENIDLEINDESLIKKLKAFGYTYDAFNMIISPMVKHAADSLGAMGNDTAFPFLSNLPRNLVYYFQQTFAQVTNPAIDPIREENIMSLISNLGTEGDILRCSYKNCQRIFLNGPILNEALYKTLFTLPDFPYTIIDMTIDIAMVEAMMKSDYLETQDIVEDNRLKQKLKENAADMLEWVKVPEMDLNGEGKDFVSRSKCTQNVKQGIFRSDSRGHTNPPEDAKETPHLKKKLTSKFLVNFIDSINLKVENAVRKGCQLIILSHRKAGPKRIPIFSILIVGALHKYLLSRNLRTKCSIIVKAGDCFEIHHLAVLLSFGADCIYPFVLYESLQFIKFGDNEARISTNQMISNYRHAANYGILKIMSKNGISTLPSYKGCGLMQPLGISDEILKKCFINVCDSIIGGVTFEFVEKEMLKIFYNAYPKKILSLSVKDAVEELDDYGEYHFRSIGKTDIHMNHPETISLLQEATKSGNREAYKKYAELQNELTNHCEIRGQLEINYKKCPSFNKKKKRNEPISINLVEPVNKILLRFCTGAMSFGSLSEEAHTTVATAMNSMGLKSNTGEGGEAEDRINNLGTEPNTSSAVKQIASARFGVTAYSLVNAQELQIKVAQGSKPGEGGELPGYKVSAKIASIRRSTPGVGLISPPPHHDMYSIEDVGQLVYDLKNINKEAKISVKLVSKLGIGVITAGVVKGNCEQILISGMSGGTGASKWTSIKHTGLPWEIGLAEAHQTLCKSNLRKRVILQIDGQLKTGRDIILGALLGAESFSFATQPLIALGCLMMRKCHLNICPVGICTQDPELRKKFAGKPEYIINFFFMLAEEVREYLAKMGFRKFSQIIGRSDLLKMKDHLKYDEKRKLLDFSKLLFPGWKYYAEDEIKVEDLNKKYNKASHEKKKGRGKHKEKGNEIENTARNMRNNYENVEKKEKQKTEHYKKKVVIKVTGENSADEETSGDADIEEEEEEEDDEEKEEEEEEKEKEHQKEEYYEIKKDSYIDEKEDKEEEEEEDEDEEEYVSKSEEGNEDEEKEEEEYDYQEDEDENIDHMEGADDEYDKHDETIHGKKASTKLVKENETHLKTKANHRNISYKMLKKGEKKIMIKKKVLKPMSVFCCETQNHKLSDIIDRELIRRSKIALLNCTPVNIKMPVKNTDRAVGAMLSYHIIQKYGETGLPLDTINVKFRGTGGLSFGVFLTSGVNFELEGDANDFVGKGLSGGIISVHFPKDALFIDDCSKNVIVGNSVLYGATNGRAFFAGRAGERFAVRNSGAIAVVEGVGSHGCEYMTKGIVVVLGETGCNFAAGMSGGIAYILDVNEKNINHQMVDLKICKTVDDKMTLEKLLQEHYDRTKSNTAKVLLQNFDANLKRFTKIIPRDIKRVLTEACIEFVKTGNEDAAAILDDWASLLKSVDQPENMYKKAMQFFTTVSDDLGSLPKTLALRNIDGLIFNNIVHDYNKNSTFSIKDLTSDVSKVAEPPTQKKNFDIEQFVSFLEICRGNNRKWRIGAQIPFKCKAFTDFKNMFPDVLDDKSKELMKKYFLNEKYLLDLHLKSLNKNKFIESLINSNAEEDYFLNMESQGLRKNTYSRQNYFYEGDKKEQEQKDQKNGTQQSAVYGITDLKQNEKEGTNEANERNKKLQNMSEIKTRSSEYNEKRESTEDKQKNSMEWTMDKGSVVEKYKNANANVNHINSFLQSPVEFFKFQIKKETGENGYSEESKPQNDERASTVSNNFSNKPFLVANPNKVTGFIDYERLSHPLKDISGRVLDYSEIIVPINVKSKLHNQLLKTQASRCVDCGTPTCHYPNSKGGGCPLGNRIFDWNNLIYENEWKKALQRLLDTNNFPEFTGRICSAPCEDACILSINEKPVSIKFIELSIIECGFMKKWIQPIVPHIRTNKRVAVVGSGPAGLAAAQQLNKAGHNVTIFEKDEYFGGLLTNGIPNVRLDKKIVERRLALLRKEGIEMRNNVNVGTDILLSQLVKDYDAVLLATGFKVPRKLNIPGENLHNIYFAMDFLTACQKSLTKSDLTDDNYIDVSEKHVIVIGGGETAVDCISLAVRMGAVSVLQFTRKQKAPKVMTADSWWPGVKNVFKVEYSHDEAIIIQGRDPREYCVKGVEFIPSSKDPKRVSGIKAFRVREKNKRSNQNRKNKHNEKNQDQEEGKGETEKKTKTLREGSHIHQDQVPKLELQKNSMYYKSKYRKLSKGNNLGDVKNRSQSISSTTDNDHLINYREKKKQKEYTVVPHSQRIYKADIVILAAGFIKTDDSIWENDEIKIELNSCNCIKTNPLTYQTNHEKIFACGDCRIGSSTVVQSIAEGRDAAVKIDEYLTKTVSALPPCNTYQYYPKNYKNVDFRFCYWG